MHRTGPVSPANGRGESDGGQETAGRPSRLGEPTFLLLFVAFMALVTWYGLGMNRGLLLSSDVKSRCWPWAPYMKQTALQAQTLSDPVWQFVPYVQMARRELAAGRLPLWNPHQDGGVPLLGNYVSGLASPLLAPALLLGVESGWNLSLLVRILAAAAAAFLWLRDLGGSRSAAAVGGMAFALSGPFIAWLELPQTLVAPAVPLVLMFARRTAAAGGRRNLTGLALSTALALVGGHPEVVLFAALVAAVVAVVAAPSWRRCAITLGGASLGALLAGPVIVPFLHTWAESAERYGVNRPPQTVPLAALVRFVVPDARVGHPIAAAASISTVLLVLAVVGVIITRRERETRMWAGVAVVLLVAIYDNPLARLLASATPLYYSRALLVLSLPLIALGARGLDVIRGLVVSRSGARAGAGVVGAVALVCGGQLLWAAQGVHAVTAPEEVRRVTPILDRLLADHTVFRILPLHTFLPPNSATSYGLDDVRGYEALTPRGWLRQRRSMGLFTSTNTVSDVLEPWNLAPGGAGLDFWNVKYILVHPQLPYTAQRLDRELNLDLHEVYSGPDGRLLVNRGVLPRVRLAHGRGRCQIVEAVPTRWRVLVGAGSDDTVVVANPYYPGWRVLVDGRRQRLALQPGQPIEVPVTAGVHTVELVYRPESLSLGCVLALLGFLGLAVLWWTGRREAA